MSRPPCINDVATDTQTTYDYDLAGNRTLEKTVKSGQILQNNLIRFDAQNRIDDIQNFDFHLRYAYDDNGNRIYTHTEYTDNNGHPVNTDRWSRFDTQNRAIVVNSASSDPDNVVFGKDTHVIAYNFAGSRTSDTYLGKHLEWVTPPPYDGPGGEGDQGQQQVAHIAIFDGPGQTTTETYSYDAIGRQTGTLRDGLLQADLKKYDAAGRMVRTGAIGDIPAQPTDIPPEPSLFEQLGISSAYQIMAYDKSHLVRQKTMLLNESTGIGSADSVGTEDNDIYFTDGENPNAGYDHAGNLMGYTIAPPNHADKIYYKFDYQPGNGYQEISNAVNTTNVTESHYDANGNRTVIIDWRGGVGNTALEQRDIVYDANGIALRKLDNVGGAQFTTTRSLIVGGQLIGTDDVKAAGELANPYDSATSPGQGSAPSYYTVQSNGETWQTIARTVWGDSQLWYAIADANPSTPLQKDSIIKLPAKPNTVHNTATTFRPYDPARVLGSTNAQLPPPPGEACGGFGQFIVTVIILVVAAIVTIITKDPEIMGEAFALTEEEAAVAGAVAGNLAGQVAGNVIGVQHGFDFKSLALATVSAGVGASVGPFGSGISGAIERAALVNAITQGIGVVTGLQKSFDWQSVIASGLGAAAGELVGQGLGVNGPLPAQFTSTDIAGRFAKAFTAGTVTAIAHGGNVSVVQVAADAFGNALGEGIAGAIQGAYRLDAFKALSREQQEHILSLAQRANVNVNNQANFDILKAASDTRFAAGQDLSSDEVKKRTNAFLKLAGASDEQIGQVNDIYSTTGVLRTGKVTENFERNPDGTLKSVKNATTPEDRPAEGAPPKAFVVSRSIDTGIIGTGTVLKEFSEFVESKPVAKYTLMGLDIASGPAIFAVRTFTPVGDLITSVTSKVAGFFSDGLETAGRDKEASADGGIGGVAILQVGATGFAGAAKGIKNLLNDLRASEGAAVNEVKTITKTATGHPVLAEVEYGTPKDYLIESAKPSAKGKHVEKQTYENPGHHDPSDGIERYNPQKSVLPIEHIELFENSKPFVNGEGKILRYAQDADGNIHRFEPSIDGVYHYSGSTNGTTLNGKSVPLEVPNGVRKLFK